MPTQHLTAAVTNWREMASICQGASLRMDDSDFSQLKHFQDTGYEELSTAVDLIKQSP
jgi:hypothetical protein